MTARIFLEGVDYDAVIDAYFSQENDGWLTLTEIAADWVDQTYFNGIEATNRNIPAEYVPGCGFIILHLKETP